MLALAAYYKNEWAEGNTLLEIEKVGLLYKKVICHWLSKANILRKFISNVLVLFFVRCFECHVINKLK